MDDTPTESQEVTPAAEPVAAVTPDTPDTPVTATTTEQVPVQPTQESANVQGKSPVALIVAVVVVVVILALMSRKKKGGCTCGCSSSGNDKPKASADPTKAVEIYVGNLSYSMTDEQFRKEFERFGVVKSARIIGHRASGKSKGYGFVEMPHRKEAEIAIRSLNNREVMGRKLRVNEARHGVPRD